MENDSRKAVETFCNFSIYMVDFNFRAQNIEEAKTLNSYLLCYIRNERFPFHLPSSDFYLHKS